MGCATRWGGIRQVAENRLPFARQSPTVSSHSRARLAWAARALATSKTCRAGADRHHLSYLTLGSPCFNSIRSLYGSGSNIAKKSALARRRLCMMAHLPAMSALRCRNMVANTGK